MQFSWNTLSVQESLQTLQKGVITLSWMHVVLIITPFCGWISDAVALATGAALWLLFTVAIWHLKQLFLYQADVVTERCATDTPHVHLLHTHKPMCPSRCFNSQSTSMAGATITVTATVKALSSHGYNHNHSYSRLNQPRQQSARGLGWLALLVIIELQWYRFVPERNQQPPTK